MRVRLAVPGDRPHFVFLGPFPRGDVDAVGAIPYCRDGCSLTGITLGGPAALPLQINGPVEISEISVDGAAGRRAPSTGPGGTSPTASAADVTPPSSPRAGPLGGRVLSGGSP